MSGTCPDPANCCAQLRSFLFNDEATQARDKISCSEPHTRNGLHRAFIIWCVHFQSPHLCLTVHQHMDVIHLQCSYIGHLVSLVPGHAWLTHHSPGEYTHADFRECLPFLKNHVEPMALEQEIWLPVKHACSCAFQLYARAGTLNLVGSLRNLPLQLFL